MNLYKSIIYRLYTRPRRNSNILYVLPIIYENRRIEEAQKYRDKRLQIIYPGFYIIVKVDGYYIPYYILEVLIEQSIINIMNIINIRNWY